MTDKLAKLPIRFPLAHLAYASTPLGSLRMRRDNLARAHPRDPGVRQIVAAYDAVIRDFEWLVRRYEERNHDAEGAAAAVGGDGAA